jgi:hypothetical protein
MRVTIFWKVRLASLDRCALSLQFNRILRIARTGKREAAACQMVLPNDN